MLDGAATHHQRDFIVKRIVATIALALGITLAATACSPTPDVKIAPDTVIIDVRTPDEFSAGHVEGALNIDIQSPDFENLILSQPLDGAYLVYCRSGNRSAQAKTRMDALGFTDVTDGGSLQNASTITGFAIVQ